MKILIFGIAMLREIIFLAINQSYHYMHICLDAIILNGNGTLSIILFEIDNFVELDTFLYQTLNELIDS